MITASQSFKIFELPNKHFKNQEDAKALVTEIESVIDAKFEDKKSDFITVNDKDKLLTKADALTLFATKEDLANTKVEIIRWVFAFFATLALMIVGLYLKK